MSELKWVKTTFQQLPLRAFFVSTQWQAEMVCGGDTGDKVTGDWVHIKFADNDRLIDHEVYHIRLVSPEREALEKIVALSHIEAPLTDQVRHMVAIATAALGEKP